MEQQELFMQAQQIGQELQRVVQHKNAIEEELVNTNAFVLQLEGFPQKEGNILAPLSHGIYARSILEKKDFLVQVGAGILVERSLTDVRELLEKNISQLNNAAKQLRAQEEFYSQQLQQILAFAEQSKDSK